MTDHLKDFETLIRKHCKDAPLPNGLDTRLSELELDSLDLLDLVLAVENEFNCDINMEHVSDETSLRELAQLLPA